VNINIFELPVQVLGIYVLKERSQTKVDKLVLQVWGGFADGLVTLPRKTKYS
jgi:hypothetical protein